MADKKVCPILRVATLVNPEETWFMQDDLCMRDDCAWYEHGCPAFPGQMNRPMVYTADSEGKVLKISYPRRSRPPGEPPWPDTKDDVCQKHRILKGIYCWDCVYLAGMKEVVEWIEKNSYRGYIFESTYQYGTKHDNQIFTDLGDWQAKLKEWGIKED